MPIIYPTKRREREGKNGGSELLDHDVKDQNPTRTIPITRLLGLADDSGPTIWWARSLKDREPRPRGAPAPPWRPWQHQGGERGRTEGRKEVGRTRAKLSAVPPARQSHSSRLCPPPPSLLTLSLLLFRSERLSGTRALSNIHTVFV